MPAVIILALNIALIGLWQAGLIERDLLMFFCATSILGLIGLFVHALKSKSSDFSSNILLAVSCAGMVLPANSATGADWFQGGVSAIGIVLGIITFIIAIVRLFREPEPQA